MPLPIAVALFAAWLAGSELLREALVSEVLLERASDPASGTPRWRAALGLYFQASMLLLLLAYWAVGGFGGDGSKVRRSQWVGGGSEVRRPQGVKLVAYTFMLIFGGFMLYDFTILSLRPALALHHVVCLVAHTYVLAVGTDDGGFRWYLAAVVVLEMGSGACNLWCVWPNNFTLPIYISVMTASNLGCMLLAIRQWAPSTSASEAGKLFAKSTTVLLACIRQLLMHWGR